MVVGLPGKAPRELVDRSEAETDEDEWITLNVIHGFVERSGGVGESHAETNFLARLEIILRRQVHEDII